jgi:hypothetical protein
MVLTQNESCWSWCATREDGSLIASVGLVLDGKRRGWVIGFPGNTLATGAELWPLIKRFRILLRSGAFDELRAWVDASDQRAIEFAERMGLKYDCGPATAFAYTGADLNLYLWRKSK